MNNPETMATIGALLPLLVSVITRVQMAKEYKAIIAFVLCFVTAGIAAYFEGSLTPGDIAGNLAVVYGMAMVAYHGFFGPTGIAASVEKTILPGPITPPQ